MRSRQAHPRGAGRRLVLVVALLQTVSCASWNPFASSQDPMAEELERLEKEQRRMTRQNASAEQVQRRQRDEDPPTLEERLAQGDTHLAAGRLASALWEYSAAHRVDPSSPEPRVRLGFVHLRQNPDRARPLFESALEIDEKHASAHRGLGLALVAGGERDAGIAHLERAVILAPNSPMAREALGVSLDQVGRHEEALEQLEQALELAPHDSSILSNLGSFHLRGGRYAEAEKHLRAALRRDARDTALRENNLGLALAMQGRFDEALEAFRRAGDEQSARANLGYAHHLRGEYSLAIDEYERALVAGGDADVHVVRNLKAARKALRANAGRPAATGRREGAEAAVVAEDAPAASDAVAGTEEAPATLEDATAVEPRSDDPWLWEAPPGAAAK